MDVSKKRYKCKDQERKNLKKQQRDLMMELTMHYLLDQPDDFVDYSIDFLENVRDNKHTQLIYEQPTIETTTLPAEDDIYDDLNEVQLDLRRNSILSYKYNPEKKHLEGDPPLYPKSDGQLYFLQRELKRIFIFNQLDDCDRDLLIGSMREVQVEPGETVINDGDVVENFYVIENGTFNVITVAEDGRKITNQIYKDSGTFAQVVLLYPTKWTSGDVVAVTEGTLWALEGAVYRRVVTNANYRKRVLGELLLESLPLLKNLSKEALASLSDALDHIRIAAGKRIFAQSDPVDGIYFVLDGIVVLKYLNDCGDDVTFASVTKYGYFGETSLVSSNPRTFSAYAGYEGGRGVELFFLDLNTFERLLGPPDIVLKDNICLYLNKKKKTPVVYDYCTFSKST